MNRIALVYRDAFKPGGYPRDVQALARALVADGASVTVVAESAGGTLIDDLEARTLRWFLARRRAFDIVHVFGPFLLGHQAAIARYCGGAACVLLSPLSQLQPLAVARGATKKRLWMEAFAPVLRRMDGLHVFSDQEATAVAKWRPLRELPTLSASLGIHDDAPPEATSGRTQRSQRFEVVFFGRNDVYQKGLDIAVTAFSRFLAGGRRGSRLTIAGTPHGDSTRVLRALLRRERVDASVDLRGPVAESEKWRLLASASVLLFPSRFDGPPRPIREALAVGTPCIVSYESNMGELVESFDAGRAVALAPSEIAACLELASESAEVSRRWELGARRLSTHLNWPAVGRSYAQGYARLLGYKHTEHLLASGRGDSLS